MKEKLYLEFNETKLHESPDPLWVKIFKTLFFFIRANANLDKIRKEVHIWQVEFSNEHTDEYIPSREIALDYSGKPIFAAPTNSNYGYWLDVDMPINEYQKFKPKSIEFSEFERSWLRYFKDYPNEVSTD